MNNRLTTSTGTNPSYKDYTSTGARRGVVESTAKSDTRSAIIKNQSFILESRSNKSDKRV